MTLRDKVLEIARKEIGKMESPKGSNWGADVKKYLASVGSDNPAPWCMAFVYWCVDEACKELGLKNPLFKTPSVMWQHKQSKDKIGKRANPQPGDIFIMQFSLGKGHTGFVDTIENDTIHTIEGNSNEDGSREGYEVCAHARHTNKIFAYLKLS